MEYLYSERQIGAPASSIILTDQYAVTYYHSTVRVYDHSFVLLHEKYFYEKILDMQKINEDQFIILFYGHKVVQLTYTLDPVCFRIVEGAYLSVSDRVVMAYMPSKLSYFRPDEEAIHFLEFKKVGIQNVQHCVLLPAYIPTAIIAWKSGAVPKCSVVSLINEMIIEEFDVFDRLIGIDAYGKIMLFFYPDFIQMKYRREDFTISLNSGTSIHLKPSYTTESTILLENPRSLLCGNQVLLVNGDGSLYSITFLFNQRTCAMKRLFVTSPPTGMAISPKFLAISSSRDDSIIFHIESCDIPKEYSRCFSGGQLTDMYVKENKDIAYSSNKGVISTSNIIRFKVLDSTDIRIRPERIEIEGDSVIIVSKDGETERHLRTSLGVLHEDSQPVRQPAVTLNLATGLLQIRTESKIIAEIANVSAFSVHNDTLAYISGTALYVYALPDFTSIFQASDVSDFPERIEPNEIEASMNLEEIAADIAEPGTVHESEIHTSAMPSARIVEILVRKDALFSFLFRTSKQLYAYKLINGRLIKQFVPCRLSFGASRRALWNLEQFVYVRSRIPFCAFLSNGVFFHTSGINMHMPISNGKDIFFIRHGRLMRTQLPVSKFFLTYDSTRIVKHIRTYFGEAMPGPARLPAKRVIHQLPPDSPNYPSCLVFAKDCIVMANAGRTSFLYVPFVPMVHMAGPDGKPISEPINKEVLVDERPLVLGVTLRFRICIYSLKYEYMSDVLLEENEFVCDMKYLFGEFLVVCTSFCEGEDKFSKGRILIYLLVDIVPDVDRPHACKRLKFVAEEQIRNPCLACEEICGLLAVCVGTRLMIYDVDVNEGLIAVGRSEVSTLSTGIFVIKNYMFMSDIYRGGYFYFLRPRDPLHINLLGRTMPIEGLWNVQGSVCSTEEGTSLSLVTYNRTGSIRIYSYSPTYLPSNEGNMLIKRCEINTKVGADGPTRSTQLTDSTPLFLSGNITIALRTFRNAKARFFAECIAYHIENSCGINPRNYLEPGSHHNVECGSCVPERILLEFFFMSPSLQENVLGMAGMTYTDACKMCDTVVGLTE